VLQAGGMGVSFPCNAKGILVSVLVDIPAELEGHVTGIREVPLTEERPGMALGDAHARVGAAVRTQEKVVVNEVIVQVQAQVLYAAGGVASLLEEMIGEVTRIKRNRCNCLFVDPAARNGEQFESTACGKQKSSYARSFLHREREHGLPVSSRERGNPRGSMCISRDFALKNHTKPGEGDSVRTSEKAAFNAIETGIPASPLIQGKECDLACIPCRVLLLFLYDLINLGLVLTSS
jgi:hypothetical protein